MQMLPDTWLVCQHHHRAESQLAGKAGAKRHLMNIVYTCTFLPLTLQATCCSIQLDNTLLSGHTLEQQPQGGARHTPSICADAWCRQPGTYC